jgi:L-erythro-3,5-diaminohexanoate dehydrogenase
MTADLTGDIPLALRYGCHRVAEPDSRGGLPGVLPQAAWRLDNEPEHALGSRCEVLLDVDRLNIDAASFRQLEETARGAGVPAAELADEVGRRIAETVATRGKMHNPVTGSGGMLLGRVRRVGDRLGAPHHSLRSGDKVATLVSLTLTPLRLESILAVHLHTHQVDVRGTAVLFDSGAWARLPDFLPEAAALSALDVAGAAPQVTRLCRKLMAQRVLILGGGGKSGLLCAAAARRAGVEVLVGIENYEAAAAEAEALGLYKKVIRLDAAAALPLAEAATVAAGGEYDLVVSCVSAAGAEMAAILCTKDRGTIYFFSMATSFTAAALGAEGVSKDIDMLIGNGFCQSHAESTLELLRQEPGLRELFIRRYGGR